MPDISQLEWIDGTVYNIKDASARNSITNLGNPIVNITRNNLTFTATRADGTTFTFTQKDDDTKYTAGTAIKINSNNVISGDYKGSNGVSVSGDTISGAYTGSNGVSVNGSTISGAYTGQDGIVISGSTIKGTTLKRIERSEDNIELSSWESKEITFTINPPTGYIYLAVAGIEIRNASSGGTHESNVSTGEFHTSGGLANFHVYLHNNSADYAKVLLKVQLIVVNTGSFESITS